MAPDRREDGSPGRRQSDRLLDAIWREFDGLERDLRRDLERLEKQLDRLEQHLESRVDELEEFHITERAKSGERVREEVAQIDRDTRTRTRKMERWTKVAVAFGVLGTLAAIVEPFLLR